MYKKLPSYFFFGVSKKMKIGITGQSGRNYTGKLCVFHRGGGKKRRFRVVDFYRRLNMKGVVYKVISSSRHSALLGLVVYLNGFISTIVLSEGLDLGSVFSSGYLQAMKADGSTNMLKNLNVFTIVNNIELFPFFGSVSTLDYLSY